MTKKFNVITLCGSVKFKDYFEREQERLTLEGNIVLSPVMLNQFGSNLSDNTKQMLSEMHKQKIDMSDEIFVINKGGYIGSSTMSEIEYATKNGKIVKYLEK